MVGEALKSLVNRNPRSVCAGIEVVSSVVPAPQGGLLTGWYLAGKNLEMHPEQP